MMCSRTHCEEVIEKHMVIFARDNIYHATQYLPSMGMFLDNHDLPRFATINSSIPAMRYGCSRFGKLGRFGNKCYYPHRNALTFMYMMRGLPIVMYGSEQHAKGERHDKTTRTPMWTYGFDTSSAFFTWIRMLNW